MTTNIHSTAVIHANAQIDEGVIIGAYSVIGENVKIGKNTRIDSHVVIDGHTTIGQDNHIFSFNSLGAIPQDKKYKNEPTELMIGDRNTIREFCTFNLGTIQDIGKTVLGNDNWIMAYVHLAHDCIVGNNTIFANNASLAGHVIVEDWAIMGGFSAVHQFVRIGSHCMIGADSLILQDVPPFLMVGGNPAAPHGLNVEGLRRRQFTLENIKCLKEMYAILYRQNLTLTEAKTKLIELQSQENPINQKHLQTTLNFLEQVKRGLLR